jgi:hypothetical protein
VSHPHASGRQDHTHTLRLTFRYQDDQIKLLNVEREEMIAPAAVGAPPQDAQAGYWVEVRDSAGELLYYRPLHDPLRRDIEVFGDEPGDPIYRVDNPRRSGTFEVLVPDLSRAARFSLHGPEPRAKRARPSVELLSYEFDELRRPSDRDDDEGPEDGAEQS